MSGGLPAEAGGGEGAVGVGGPREGEGEVGGDGPEGCRAVGDGPGRRVAGDDGGLERLDEGGDHLVEARGTDRHALAEALDAVVARDDLGGEGVAGARRAGEHRRGAYALVLARWPRARASEDG